MRFLKNRTIQAALLTALVTIAVAIFFTNNPTMQEGLINTIGQIGNNTVINNPDLPKPTLTYREIEAPNQQIADNQYQTKYRATITSEFSIASTTGILIPQFCSAEQIYQGLQVIDGTSLNSLVFEITCLTDSPIQKDQVIFSLANM